LAPARRASLALWVIGGLGLLCGACLSVGIWFVPFDQFAGQLPQLTAEQQKQLGDVSIGTLLRIGFTIIGVGGLIVSLMMVLSAGFVWRGSRGASVVAIIACGLTLLWCGFAVIANIVQAASNPAALIAGLFWAMIAGAMILTVRWLILTIRAASRVTHWQQWQAQMWYHQQQQAGYGYAAPPGTGAPTAAAPPQQQMPWMNVPPPPAPHANVPPPSDNPPTPPA
jgi:hypothetical protein